MKNFFKLFGIIALVAVIGFSMAACNNDDDEDDNGGTGGNGGGSTLDWPADIKAFGDLKFQPTNVGVAYIRFRPTYKNFDNQDRPGYLQLSNSRAFLGNTYYETVGDYSLSSAQQGGKIEILISNSIKVLCTSYAVTGSGNTAKITFTGGDELFAKITDVELSVTN